MTPFWYDEGVNARDAIVRGPCHKTESADHGVFHHVVVPAAFRVRPLGLKYAEVIAMVRLGFNLGRLPGFDCRVGESLGNERFGASSPIETVGLPLGACNSLRIFKQLGIPFTQPLPLTPAWWGGPPGPRGRPRPAAGRGGTGLPTGEGARRTRLRWRHLAESRGYPLETIPRCVRVGAGAVGGR